jgi:membrane-associated HD superfamily phosphohydrolase
MDMSYNDLDVYNLKNIYSTVKPEKSLLVNKNIDDYFNEIINVSDKPKTYKIVNKTSFFSKFYKDYLENNMLLIFVIFIIIIFLTIRYYTKDIENEYFNNNKNLRKNVLHTKKINNQINTLKKYKKKLDNQKEKLNNDKEKILSIIDELSNINYELDSVKYTIKNNNKSNSQSNNHNNYNNQNNHIYKNNNYPDNDFNDIKNNLVKNVSSKIGQVNNKDPFVYNDKIRNLLEEDNSSPSSKIFYDINKKLNDSDLVDGMYIEPPYM